MQGGVKALVIRGTADFNRPQGCQMRRQELRVKQGKAARAQPMHQPCQRDLWRIRPARKHAFAKNRSAQFHAVDAADKRLALPYLKAMGMAPLMQRQIKLRDRKSTRLNSSHSS